VRITVRVKPGARTEGVLSNPDGSLTVQVRERPVAGQANAAVIELLARYFRVPKRSVRLVAGVRSRQKVFEVDS
jgi:uncharacterized protein YggU (UPF0235/DUF167 family)